MQDQRAELAKNWRISETRSRIHEASKELKNWRKTGNEVQFPKWNRRRIEELAKHTCRIEKQDLMYWTDRES